MIELTAKQRKNRRYYQKHRARILQREKARYAANPEVYKAKSRAWYVANPEKAKLARGRYYRANADVAKKRAADWAKAHPEQVRTWRQDWKKTHKALVNADTNARRRKLRDARPAWADEVAIRRFYRDCPKGYHVDHVIPLRSKLVCGLHVETNLQYLPARENQIKNNRWAA